jgi:hypothetical protein
LTTPSEAPIQIEPLTKEEHEKRGTSKGFEDSPDFPKDWKNKADKIAECIDKGFKYYRRKIGDKIYMVLRKGKQDRGLGQWSEEKEGKLFTFYPTLGTYAGIPRPPPWVSPGATPQGRSFLSIPISRVAIIPRDYVPSINVIRYFQIIKQNGFPGDFSQFINDIVTEHFGRCHGIVLPVLVEETSEEMKENVAETCR